MPKRASVVLARIGAAVWEFSRADFKRFGPDALALKLRAKSARTRFVLASGEWFRWTGKPSFGSDSAVTPCEARAIREAVVLPP